MKKYFLFLFIILLQFFASPVFALDIIFPQKNPHTTKAKESYFLGNVAKKSKLTINNAPVKLYKNGAFCHIVEINDGINKFVLKEKNGKKTITKIYTINKNIPTSKETEKSKRQEKITYDTLRLANIITDRAPIRNTPSDSGKRISHLPNNTKIIIEEEYKNWYKINNEDSNDPLWIHKNNAKNNVSNQ